MISGEIFLDTVALIALVNFQDKYYQQSQNLLEEIDDAGATLVTTNLIPIEAADYLQARATHRLTTLALDSVLALKDSEQLSILFVDESLLFRAWELLKSRSDKDWGLTDCNSFVVMQERGIRTAFTADRHFEQAGFERLLHD